VKKPIIDYKDGIFLVNGKVTRLWVVGGSGDLYQEGNSTVISGEALRRIISKTVDGAMAIGYSIYTDLT
jgi:hypothetical protein